MSTTNSNAETELQQIQKRTFTRWCNEHLKKQDTKIEKLEEDFSDGIRLIILMQVLSEKMIGRYNKKPRIRAQQMENVQLALEFIKKQNIQLVNIGSDNIVDGDLKLILGLIWTLILHYQIGKRFNITTVDAAEGKSGSTAPKQALLQWLQRKLPDKKITNFTKDWNDGTLIAALVDAMAPGLCPEHDAMDPNNALQNATHAMRLAEDWLEVPQLVGPDDMVHLSIDELSMMTYLSLFHDAKLKPGAPVNNDAKQKPTTQAPVMNGSSSETPAIANQASKVKVFGPGVQREGIDTEIPSADFIIDMRDQDGTIIQGDVVVGCVGPAGPVPVSIQENGDGTFKCSYEPRDVGKYKVTVECDESPVDKSPYIIIVSPSEAQKVIIESLGERLANMMVDAFNAGSGSGDFNVGLDFGLSANSRGSN